MLPEPSPENPTALHRRRWSARLVARQSSELLLGRSGRWQALVQQDWIAGAVFEVVLSASIAHYPLRDPNSGRWHGIREAGVRGRPVSATAIAHSMNLPLTSVRRHAAHLVETGLLVRDITGFRIAADFLARGELARVIADNAAALTQIVSELADAGYEPAVRASHADVSTLPTDVVERILLAFALRTLETFVELYDDFTTGAIVATIIAANVRHITRNPKLALDYAAEDTPPPDDLRQPISLRSLARALDLPFETVRRRVNMQIANGVILSKAGGVIVPAQVLQNDRHIENNRRILLHFDQMLSALVAAVAQTRA